MSYVRGTLYLTIGWGLFIASSAILYVGMARVLGPEGFGLLGLVLSILYWLEIVLMYGIPYTLQKVIPEKEAEAPTLLGTSLIVQSVIAVILWGGLWALAPWLSRHFQKAVLASLLRWASLDLIPVGLFSLITAHENGFRRFHRQALLFGVWSALRVGMMFLAYALRQSLVAVVIGNAMASGVCLLWAYGAVRPRVCFRRPLATGTLGRFAFFSAVYFLLFHLFFFVDLWTVQYFRGLQMGGLYVAASTIAKIPVFLFYGFSMTMLPMLSRSLQETPGLVIPLVQQGFYALVLVVMPISALLSALAPGFIALFFPEPYGVASSILAFLVWGMGGLSCLALITTVLNADGKISQSVMILGGSILLDIFLNQLLVPRWGGVGGALATTIAVFFGMVLAARAIHRRFGQVMTLSSLIRMGMSSAMLYVVGVGRSQTPLRMGLIFLFGMVGYLIMLYCLGEKARLAHLVTGFRYGG